MNHFYINSFFQKTNITTLHDKLKLKRVKYLPFESFQIVSSLLTQFNPTPLPFLLKIKFIKTIRSTVPQIQYQYIFPSERRIRSLNYYKNIQNNSSSELTALSVYSSLLKI